jgi:uncharacterized protein (DUF433 family)
LVKFDTVCSSAKLTPYEVLIMALQETWLTPREVAAVADAPKKIVDKAIEDRVLKLRGTKQRSRARQVRQLGPEAVPYAAFVAQNDLKLTTSMKKDLVQKLQDFLSKENASAKSCILPISKDVSVDFSEILKVSRERLRLYRGWNKWIVSDENILGGTPVLKGTRITVYSLLGRVEHGDSVDDILDDNPDLSRDAVEAGVLYARANPLVGRPSGRPWK